MHNVLTCPVLPTLTQAANHHTLADHLTPWARLAGGDRMDQSASTRSSTQIAINRRANMGSEVAPMQIDRVRNTSTTSTATATAITTTSSTTETTSPTITARTPVRPTTVRPALNTTMAAEQYRDDDGGGGTGPPPPKVCFNSKCLTTDSPSWKPSWMLRSGRIADLCETCGSAYERLCFCETFHWNDSGWRACISCQQWVHCGCIASASAYILVDGGGVQCMNCTSNKFSNPVPPVFGKRTIYMSRQGRASCTAPQDLKNEEVNRLFPGKEVRKEETQEVEIEAPANLEEDLQQLSPPVATTKHPRHRPGCSCIVCTQAPSGKGPKHKPSCICNMCVIVSRRFQTKMSKCRKGQSEEGQKGNDMKKHIGRTGGKEVVSWANPHRETQSVHEDRHGKETLFEALDRASPTFMSNLSSRVNRPSLSEGYPSKPRSSAEENMLEETLFDLNSQPEQDDESFKVTGGETMTMLLQNANHTLERYLQQQGISSLSCLSKTVEDFHCK